MIHGDGNPAGPIIFVGNATQDLAFFVQELPDEDEVCAVRKSVNCLGGRGVVPALVAAALGFNAELCTVVGSDRRDEFAAFLQQHHVGTSGVKWDDIHPGVTQYVAFISDATGRSVAIAQRPQLDWRSTAAQRELVKRARAAYFSTNDLGFNLELLGCVPSNVPVVHNLGIRIADRPEYLGVMLRTTTVLIGNRVEMKHLRELTNLTPQGMFESSSSMQDIIITAGGDGAQHFRRGDNAPVSYPTVTVERVRSPVGAGDSFAVGVLWSVISGKSRREGIRLGMTLGALAVASELSYPDLADVAEMSR